ncbi:ABC transporter substrate-binding protein [Cellulomonas hominis]|uniref:ABC transporter substrate-binding protein n=1 Tax=Cellulomonas hominis TaxID=156981 RepID=UPI001B92A152|nr:extracellular solute-binding protein [Cellulomonas hominis]VTR75768.1 hypothetical protein CHMI_00521 [Cellulomonas hominis]
MARKHAVTAMVALTTLALTTACSGGDDGNGSGGEGGVSGEITVLTNRTDIVDTTLQDYVAQFQETYPDVDVEFEALTDYEGDVSIRLSSQDYGDVLLIPNTVTKDQLPQFFEPLGTTAELEGTYRFLPEQSYDGQVYGIATFGTAMGYALNTKVWAEAGITEPPATEEEFLDALRAIDEKTDAVPYYTNYADGWPLSQWQSNQGSVAGPTAIQERDADDAPWSEGKEQYAIDGLLFDVVAEGLTEEDPTTTNWEESKNLLGSGEIATMVLGSWAVPQMQAAAEAVGGSPDDIGFWPMPWQTDGTFRSTVGGDYKIGISKHSGNKEAARAWVDWFLDESTFAEDQGGISPLVGADAPATLTDFEAVGVEQVEIAPAPEGEESLDSDIYQAAEIDLFGDQYRRQLVDVARGAASGDKASFFDDLNARWAQARATVAG